MRAGVTQGGSARITVIEYCTLVNHARAEDIRIWREGKAAPLAMENRALFNVHRSPAACSARASVYIYSERAREDDVTRLRHSDTDCTAGRPASRMLLLLSSRSYFLLLLE